MTVSFVAPPGVSISSSGLVDLTLRPGQPASVESAVPAAPGLAPSLQTVYGFLHDDGPADKDRSDDADSFAGGLKNSAVATTPSTMSRASGDEFTRSLFATSSDESAGMSEPILVPRQIRTWRLRSDLATKLKAAAETHEGDAQLTVGSSESLPE